MLTTQSESPSHLPSKEIVMLPTFNFKRCPVPFG